MADYDFRALNDKEFENFVTDILSHRDSVHYERFKPGKDSGVDGRYFRPDGKEVLLQCKHWPNSSLEKLVKHLEVTELPKVQKLNPAQYILAVSNQLSRNDKTRIANLFAPYIKSPVDVIGREDLNDLFVECRINIV